MAAAKFFEPLEGRSLMSASIVNGVLTVTGTDRNDTITISQDTARVRVNEGGRVSAFALASVKRITVHARGGHDTVLGRPNLTKPMAVYGEAGNDTLTGGSGNDSLFGGDDEDRLDGAKGTDLLSGGARWDLVDYGNRAAGVSVSLDDVANDGQRGERDNVRSDVEGVITGKGNDRVTGSAADNVIRTGDGADTVYGMGGNDVISTGDTAADKGLDRIYGGDGNDWIRSPFSSLIAYGDAGNDALRARDRASTLYGGAGNDHLEGSGANDLLDGGDEDDVIHGWSGNDTIRGGAGVDWIYGDAGNDLLWGEAPGLSVAVTPIGNAPIGTGITPTLAGGLVTGGISTGVIRGPIVAGGGSGGPVVFKPVDPAIVSNVNRDTIFCGEGHDTAHGGDGNDRVNGETGNDRLYGDAGADDVRGAEGDDELFGGAGDDELRAGPGQDTLVSIGGGTDKLFGEADGDRFWKDPADTTDADLGEGLFGGVQEVASFANGASPELNGQDLPDPLGTDFNNAQDAGDNYYPSSKNFAANPLFGGNGILATDVRPGGVEDENLLGVLRALAGKNAVQLRSAIVDLGDGTFAVRLIAADGSHRYYRVDADLPTKPDGTPYYAGLGNGGALWAAVIEKAFALHRPVVAGLTYHSLQRISDRDAFAAFGLRQRDHGTGDAWAIRQALASGHVVTMHPTISALSGAAPLVNAQYLVERVNMELQWQGKEWNDTPVSITLRGPNDREMTVRGDQFGRFFTSLAVWK
jgi:Ca2+-binding RTX toxin-like protein